MPRRSDIHAKPFSRLEPAVDEERAFHASRVQSSLLVVALGVMLLLFGQLAYDRPRLQLTMCAACLGILLARAWARRPPGGAFADLPIHFAIACAAAAVFEGALLARTQTSIVQYYLLLVPAFAACLLSLRATVFWAIVTIALFPAIRFTRMWVGVEPESPGGPLELAIAQTTLVLMVLGASLSQWRATARQFARIRAREITILEQARELEQARDLALQASRVKSQFLATVSHEIRTPMNAVIGLTDLVLETKLDDEQRSMLETASRSGDALLGILNDILDFSKIESDRIELEARNFSLRECIEDAMELLAARAMERNVELLCDHPRSVVDWIVGDPTRLRQVVVNLLSNAVKFTEDGDVTVSVSAESDPEGDPWLRISVRDTGIGIAADRQEHLFEPFTQADASTTRRFGGTGLGLAISKRLVERMGGGMLVDSVVGRGSEFSFTLPAVVAPADPAAGRFAPEPLERRRLAAVHPHRGQCDLMVRDARDYGMELRATQRLDDVVEWIAAGEHFDALLVDSRILDRDGLEPLRNLQGRSRVPAVLLAPPGRNQADGEVRELGLFRARVARPVRSKRLAQVMVSIWYPKQGEPVDATSQAAALPKLGVRIPLSVLVAEDNGVNQRVARMMLERLGYMADIVSDGVEALEAARRNRYDLILMDVQMPRMDGLEASREIRALDGDSSGAHIVALTANAMPEDRRLCLDAGMDDFLTKPLTVGTLAAAIERCGERASRVKPSCSPARLPEPYPGS